MDLPWRPWVHLLLCRTQAVFLVWEQCGMHRLHHTGDNALRGTDWALQGYTSMLLCEPQLCVPMGRRGPLRLWRVQCALLRTRAGGYHISAVPSEPRSQGRRLHVCPVPWLHARTFHRDSGMHWVLTDGAVCVLLYRKYITLRYANKSHVLQGYAAVLLLLPASDRHPLRLSL